MELSSVLQIGVFALKNDNFIQTPELYAADKIYIGSSFTSAQSQFTANFVKILRIVSVKSARIISSGLIVL